MKAFAEKFYNSRAWKETRREYAKSVGGLCEECLRQGKYNAGEIVHHKTPLTPENVTDPTITLSWNNLEYVCRECHAVKHGEKKRRYKVDALGRVISPV